MALSLAFLSRQMRTTGAFTMRSLTTSISSANNKMSGKYSKFSINVVTEGETDNMDAEMAEGAVNGDMSEVVEFPLLGKNVLDCPPRMRFAPSPTGR